MKAMLKVLILSLVGGYIFSLLHIPIPWMLGPIFVMIMAQFVYEGELQWSAHLRDLGIIIVGTAIGLQFNVSLFSMIGSILFYMVALNIILIGGAIFIAYLTSKWTNIPFEASVLGAIPGGLGQIIVFAEDAKIKEIGVISYFQVIRLILVVILVPFIVAGEMVNRPPNDATFTWGLLLCLAVAWACAIFTKRFNFSVSIFITPIILFIVLQLATPLTMPAVPDLLMVIAQLLIGAHIGLMLKPNMVKLPKRVLFGGLFSALALVALTFGSSFIMTAMMDTSFATSFLSTAPGGLDQMVLLADAIKADASLVSMFQTFRLLFIFLVVLPLMKMFYQWYSATYKKAV